ncbi:retropepsin-like aspartic protease family protein [Methylobacterium segetis]|uniref:retropepsin-like aspartic protease family protein n=1 Tax=Methylobacterium segetis TaxID=2488750 RepID=UPI001051C5FD|nr:TIGR02281 family clan AA aspartic protease [Methylobacterium segetis]
MLILGLIVLGIALLLLVTADGGRIAGVIEPDQLAGLASGVAVLALVLAGFRHRFREGIGTNLRHLLIWGLIGLACVALYAYRDTAQEVGARVMGELNPGSATIGPGGSVTVTRRADGPFAVKAEVNGRSQNFLFDTGASAVVLTAENAAALGIRPGEDAFTTRVATANGVTFAAPILLDSLRIGPILERRVPAMVSRPGALAGNLLGQSFLNRLPSYEVRGDRLILKGP